jgi:hypothetical protein
MTFVSLPVVAQNSGMVDQRRNEAYVKLYVSYQALRFGANNDQWSNKIGNAMGY